MPKFSKGDVVRFQALDAKQRGRIDLVIIKQAEFGKVVGYSCCRLDSPDKGPVGTFNVDTLHLQKRATPETVLAAQQAQVGDSL